MEEYIGTGLLILVAILLRQYILDNAILQNGEANTIIATAFSLTVIGLSIVILVE